MNETRLLLLEDDAVSLAFLHEALSSLGVPVDAVRDCAQAEARAAPAHALYVFDACLPDGNGADVLRRLRVRLPRVPALALTADVETHGGPLRAAGFDRVEAKPVDGDRLRRTALALLANAAVLPLAMQWDDARALPTVGFRADALEALRDLFRGELPMQLRRVSEALAREDHAAARAELHRLKAGCGFVGATRLHEAVDALYARPDDGPALHRFLRVGEDQLAGD